MKHFVLFLLFSFFIIFNTNVNAKVEQSLNEYKIEQLQKGIDDLKKEIEELKKDVDDTKEKKIENKKDNESLDKRIGDINFNITAFAIFITVLLLGFGFLAYRNAKADAKKEAEDTTKNWLENDGNNQLTTIINKLEEEARHKIEEAVKTAKEDIKKQAEAEDLFLQGRSYYLNKEYENAKEYYNKALQAGHKGALNNLGVLYCNQGNYKKAEEYYNEALESGDNRALINFGNLYKEQKGYEKAEDYYNKALQAGYKGALNNFGNLYSEQKEYEKAEEYYLKAIDAGDNNALNNLRILYTEKNEHTKLEELNQKYKI